MIPPGFTVTEANCGMEQDPVNSDPPVNLARGALVGIETAGPILSAVNRELVGVPVCTELEESVLEVLELEPEVVIAAQPRKFGIVTLTPEQS